MKRILIGIALLILSFNVFAADSAYVLTVSEGIGPATSEYISAGLKQANIANAKIVVIKLDTPGGLDKSMRIIIQSILQSPIPVATFVYPSGSHAASAGTFILYASQIAAMAPGTNLGAASPVAIGADGLGDKDKSSKQDTMMKKVQSDAIAYIRSLAELHGRNAAWGEKAVKEAASLTAEKALKKNVINVMATDVPDLLKKIDGMTVKVQDRKVKLATKNLSIINYEPTWRIKVLNVIASPSIAYILLLVGIYGIIFELMNPGMIVPGVIGLVSLLFAVYGLHLLPVNYVGLMLLLVGIVLMVLEIFVSSFGILAIAGVVSFLAGSLLLFEAGSQAFEVALPVIIGVTIVTAAFFLIVVRVAIRSFRKPVVTGKEEILNAEGVVSLITQDQAYAIFNGERWQIQSKDSLKVGDRVKVLSRHGLILIVGLTKS